jgi:hypothetical protein
MPEVFHACMACALHPTGSSPLVDPCRAQEEDVMPSDDFSSPEAGPPFTSATGHSHDNPGDELDEASERLDSSWDRFEAPPAAMHHERSSALHEEGSGAIRGFLERQLDERPLPTLLAAVAAGWLIGKLLR